MSIHIFLFRLRALRVHCQESEKPRFMYSRLAQLAPRAKRALSRARVQLVKRHQSQGCPLETPSLRHQLNSSNEKLHRSRTVRHRRPTHVDHPWRQQGWVDVGRREPWRAKRDKRDILRPAGARRDGDRNNPRNLLLFFTIAKRDNVHVERVRHVLPVRKIPDVTARPSVVVVAPSNAPAVPVHRNIHGRALGRSHSTPAIPTVIGPPRIHADSGTRGSNQCLSSRQIISVGGSARRKQHLEVRGQCSDFPVGRSPRATTPVNFRGR
jgi:hypothetical protein